ncbi:MAG: hypothetical protein QOG34_657 [Frankiaceae bacterium]|nr:hypothetical protein [Frankiaceae bacterium]
MRASVLAGSVVLLGVALTACKGTQREVIVFFAADAPQTQHEDALRACTGVANHTSPEPIEPGTHRVAATSDVRFRIDKANDHDIAQLEKCLSKQPGVIGVQDTMDTT